MWMHVILLNIILTQTTTHTQKVAGSVTARTWTEPLAWESAYFASMHTLREYVNTTRHCSVFLSGTSNYLNFACLHIYACLIIFDLSGLLQWSDASIPNLSLQRNKRLFIPHPVFQHWSFQHQSGCRLKVLSAVRLQTIQLRSHESNDLNWSAIPNNFMHGIPRSRQGERRFSNVWGQHNVTPSTWALSIYCSNYSLIIVCGHIKAPACNVDTQNSTSPLKEWTIQFNPIYIELETSKLRWCRKSTEHSCPAQVASAACRLLEDLFLLRSWHLSTTPCGLLQWVPAFG